MEAKRRAVIPSHISKATVAGLYVHVPFRRIRRLYDEAHYVTGDPSDVEEFAHSVASDVRQLGNRPPGEMKIETVYIGGGRPGLLSLDSIRAILDAVRAAFGGPRIQEASIELTPDEVTPDRLGALCDLGITRVSLEGLSLVDRDLEALGAPHTLVDARQAIGALEMGAVTSFSVDLAFGHAGQRLANWKSSLYRATELGVPHVTIQEIRRSEEENEADAADCLAFAMTFLKAKGYEQYELTHFARPGHASHHQRNYYAHGNYLGVGPSAESFWWPDCSTLSTARRWSNVDDIARYVDRLERGDSPARPREELEPKILAREYILLRLRTDEGLDLDALASRYGVDLRSEHGALLNRLVAEGLARTEGHALRLTDSGRLVTDAITEQLLPT